MTRLALAAAFAAALQIASATAQDYPSRPITMIVGKTALPANDAKELIAWLKENPDKASAASVGAGSGAHICGLYFQEKTGTRFQFVPYRGGAPAMQDLVSGQIDLMCAEASQTLPHVRA